MIAALRGSILAQQGNNLVVDVGGVGYALCVTQTVLQDISGVGEEVSLLVYTDVRENDNSLFGFCEPTEKELFLLLKKVKGVGSKLALTIVSCIPSEDLLLDISKANVAALQKIPGIGKKTAERLIVELREAVGNFAKELESPLTANASSLKPQSVAGAEGLSVSVSEDAVLALQKLGFSYERASDAVMTTLREEAQAHPNIVKDPGELVKQALGNL